MNKRLRILAINPNSDENTCIKMRNTVEKFVGGEYDVDVVRLKTAPILVLSYEDHITALDELCNLVRQSKDKYDAFIIACHSDPNLELIRELTKKPVVGIAEASMKLASSMGNGFAVISPSPKSVSKKFALAHKYHLRDFLKTVVVTKSDSPEDLLKAAEEAMKTPCVDAIVLGCANYTGADAYIEQRLGIPVIDGFAGALFMAAGLARYQRYKS